MIELFLSDSRALLQDIFAWMICIAALVWGGGPERAVALVWLILFELVQGAFSLTAGGRIRVEDVDPFFAIVDTAALICWVSIALYANRNYTLWVAAMQVLAMTAHMARGLVEAISPVAYVTMIAVPGWFQLVLFTAGFIRHILRKRRYGQYRDWRVVRRPHSVPANGPKLPEELVWPQAPKPTWRDDLK